MSWLRRQIGAVLQENVLFNQSIRDNISLPDPASPSPIGSAPKQSHHHHRSRSLGGGWNTRRTHQEGRSLCPASSNAGRHPGSELESARKVIQSRPAKVTLLRRITQPQVPPANNNGATGRLTICKLLAVPSQMAARWVRSMNRISKRRLSGELASPRNAKYEARRGVRKSAADGYYIAP